MVLVGLTSLIAMIGPIVVRKRMSLEQLRTNNEVAGFKFATVGVIYAVLLGFAVIVVWQKFSEAENDVALEAGAAATIYRLANGVHGEPGLAIRDGITAYLQAAITDDWPAMKEGKASTAATVALNNAYAAALEYEPDEKRGTAIFAEVLHQLDQVTQARRARIVVAAGIVPGIVWLVLFGGAFITIGFTFFFGTANLRAQTLMTGALSVLIFSALLVIIAIDHPFAGTVKVDTAPLADVLMDFGGLAKP
jgi:Na+/melibiose symporter-like transporter